MMSQVDRLIRIFGPDIVTSSPEESARTSRRLFVRGKSQLALYENERQPKGHIISAWEAFQSYGLDVLDEVIEYGSAILTRGPNTVGKTIKSRREELGLQAKDVARRILSSEKQLQDIESGGGIMEDIERVAFFLGLDEAQLGFGNKAGSDPGIAARLKTLQTTADNLDIPPLRPNSVITFAEAASVIRTQLQMQRWLNLSPRTSDFRVSINYGSATSPAWKIGYSLAETTRSALGLGDGPIESMRVLTEEQFKIPVVQAELPERIAGATVSARFSSKEVRGIVLNTRGSNQNPWVRRATLAHELGHLLYDPEQELEAVRVDSYANLESNPAASALDVVEQRANAFAIALLAPLDRVRELTHPPITREAVEKVMALFGISSSAARYHVVNAHFRAYDAPNEHPNVSPDDKWKAMENFAIDYFPITSTPTTRKGRFAGLVVACLDRGLISNASAASYLNCHLEDVKNHLSAIRSLYPI